MDYGMIGKIEKAKIYAEERDRIEFESFQVNIQGDNDSHIVPCRLWAYHDHGARA
jgi:hypothetical protein